MRASTVALTDYKTYTECQEAIDAIFNDYDNIVGGINAWMSGRETALTSAAEKKITQLEARSDRLFDKQMKESGCEKDENGEWLI